MELEAGGLLQVQGHPGLYSGFKFCLNYETSPGQPRPVWEQGEMCLIFPPPDPHHPPEIGTGGKVAK